MWQSDCAKNTYNESTLHWMNHASFVEYYMLYLIFLDPPMSVGHVASRHRAVNVSCNNMYIFSAEWAQYVSSEWSEDDCQTNALDWQIQHYVVITWSPSDSKTNCVFVYIEVMSNWWNVIGTNIKFDTYKISMSGFRGQIWFTFSLLEVVGVCTFWLLFISWANQTRLHAIITHLTIKCC
jgi:hypothetical protein